MATGDPAILDGSGRQQVAGLEIFRDALILNRRGEHAATVDQIAFVRNFFPRVLAQPELSRLGVLQQALSADPELATACRYFRKGVLERTPDSIVHFWTALGAR